MWGPCQGETVPSPEICDGKDNDCNGASDENLGSVECGQGICKKTAPSCINGKPGQCIPGPPKPEACNGLDDNCNGQADEGNPGGGTACTTGLPGVCAAGTQQCVNGMPVCNQSQMSANEVCNDNQDNNCDGQVDEGCSIDCANIAPQATPTTTSGGQEPGYGPQRLNNGVGQTCTEWSWIFNTDTSSGKWFQYEWPTPRTIGSFYVDGMNATAPSCPSSQGRDIKSAIVQWWNGMGWVNAGMLSNQENYMFVFPTPVTTTKLRLWDVKTSTVGFAQNSVIFEWYVFPGSNCPTPP